VLALIPVITDSYYLLSVLTLANLYAVFVVSWDIVSGYIGKLNLGQALFIGFGAYAVGILHDSIGIIPSMLVGALLSVLAALVIGVASLKLTGPYFSLTTMALPLIFYQLAYTFRDLSGGEFGLNISGGVSRLTLFYITLGFMLICVLFTLSIVRSRTGKIFIAIREDELGCAALGNNVLYYKLLAFSLSALMSGLGGGLLAVYLRHVSPQVFELWQSLIILIMGIAGGMGTILGPMLGAYGLSFLTEWLRSTEQYQDLIYAGLLVIFVMLLPNGLATLRRHLSAFRNKSSG
jgi:branched-chain amino acid transport system permease protein